MCPLTANSGQGPRGAKVSKDRGRVVPIRGAPQHPVLSHACTRARRPAAALGGAAAFKTPLKPEVGFLLRYVGVAASLWLKEAHKPQFVPPVQSIASNPAQGGRFLARVASRAKLAWWGRRWAGRS
jgi:hypothetical protein